MSDSMPGNFTERDKQYLFDAIDRLVRAMGVDQELEERKIEALEDIARVKLAEADYEGWFD